MRTNHKGFGALEILIAIVIVVVVAAAGYWYWHAKQTPPAKSLATATKTAPTTEQQSAVDQYANWKEFCSTVEKACFKYPADWTITSETDSAENTSSTKVVSLAGSTVVFDPTISGIGGGCDEATDTHIFVVKAEPQTYVDGIYVVQTGKGSASNVDHIGLSTNNNKGQPATGDTGQCLYYTIFTSHADPNYGAWLQTSGTLSTNDIAAVEKIMQSYKYQ